MKTIFKAIVILLFMVSCQGNTKDKAINNENKQVENFEEFIEHFSVDTIFQQERIQFPLKYSYPEDYEEPMTVTHIKKEDWKHIDLRWDSTYLTRPTDNYERKIMNFKDSAYVKLAGVNYGLYLKFTFIKEGSEWQLKEYLDGSM